MRDVSPEEKWYCLYHNAESKMTTLLIGDSHVLASFDSIAEYNASIGINTLMMYFTGSDISDTPPESQRIYLDRLMGMMKSFDLNISKIFIIERGMLRIDGNDIDIGRENFWYPLGEEGFQRRMQYMVDRLREIGREVFIVSENPVLYTDIRNLIQIQPFRPAEEKIPVYTADVLKHQEKYLNALKCIEGATVIYSLDAFCPRETCLLTDEDDLPLYRDDDHLSRWPGGRFLVGRVLKPYLTLEASTSRDGQSDRAQ